MNKEFSFQNSKLHYVSERIGNNQWIYVNGRTLCIPLEDSIKKSRKSETTANRNQVMAPMPGKVTKVIVQEGSQVSKGDSVIVMEAMKMEYTQKAEMSGRVKKVLVTSGQQVNLGQLLVEFEEGKIEKD